MSTSAARTTDMENISPTITYKVNNEKKEIPLEYQMAMNFYASEGGENMDGSSYISIEDIETMKFELIDGTESKKDTSRDNYFEWWWSIYLDDDDTILDYEDILDYANGSLDESINKLLLKYKEKKDWENEIYLLDSVIWYILKKEWVSEEKQEKVINTIIGQLDLFTLVNQSLLFLNLINSICEKDYREYCNKEEKVKLDELEKIEIPKLEYNSYKDKNLTISKTGIITVTDNDKKIKIDQKGYEAFLKDFIKKAVESADEASTESN